MEFQSFINYYCFWRLIVHIWKRVFEIFIYRLHAFCFIRSPFEWRGIVINRLNVDTDAIHKLIESEMFLILKFAKRVWNDCYSCVTIFGANVVIKYNYLFFFIVLNPSKLVVRLDVLLIKWQKQSLSRTRVRTALRCARVHLLRLKECVRWAVTMFCKTSF